MSFLSLQLNELLQSEIMQKLSSVQKITCITALLASFVLLLAEWYCAPHLSLLFQLIASSALFYFLLISTGKRRKATISEEKKSEKNDEFFSLWRIFFTDDYFHRRLIFTGKYFFLETRAFSVFQLKNTLSLSIRL